MDFTGDPLLRRRFSAVFLAARSDVAAQIRREWLAKQLSELEAAAVGAWGSGVPQLVMGVPQARWMVFRRENPKKSPIVRNV